MVCGSSTEEQEEVGIPSEGGGREAEVEGKEIRRYLLAIPQLTFHFSAVPHPLLDRMDSWKWFKSNIEAVCL